MKFKSFLIKYAEIGVKGKNRFLFEDALVRQINLSDRKSTRLTPVTVRSRMPSSA